MSASPPPSAPARPEPVISPARLHQALRLNILAGTMGVSWYVVCGPGNLMNVFFKTHLGATPFQLGLLVALMQLGAVFNLVGIVAFHLLKTRKPIWMATHIVMRLLSLVMAVAALIVARNGDKQLGILLILWSSGLCWALTHTTSSGWWSWMADLIPENTRASFFGRRSSILNFAVMIWSFIAAVIVDHSHGNGVFYAYAGIFTVVAILGTADILCFIRMPEPRPATDDAARRLDWRLLTEPLRQRNFLGFCLAVGTFGLSVSVAGPFFAPYVAESLGIGAPQTWLSILLFITQMACILTAPFWGMLMDRFGRKPAVMLGALFPFTWAAYLFITPGNYIYILPIQALAVGMIISGWNDGVNQLMLTLTPSRNRTTYVAWYTAIASLIAAIGSLGGGWLYEALRDLHVESSWLPDVTGFHVVIIVSMLLCTLSQLVLSRIREGNTRPVGFLLTRLASPGIFRTFLNLNTLVGTSDSDTVVRALRDMDDSSGELLVKDILARLDDPDPEVRTEAVRALGRLRSTEAVEALIQRLCDANSPIRGEAARALGKIGDPRATPFLISALEKTASEEFQEACIEALGAIGSPESADRLMQLLKEPRAERVLVSSAEAVSKLGTLEAAWEVFPRMHKTENPVLRRQLAIAVGNILGGPGEFYRYATRAAPPI